jgi:hypothetical protein
LYIGSKSEDVVSFPERGLLPSSLTYLHILGFLNLKSLDKNGLQHLTSLQGLTVHDCPKLNYMPDEGLPPSLSFIKIKECPLLKNWWQSRKKIPDVDHIEIDYEEYSG